MRKIKNQILALLIATSFCFLSGCTSCNSLCWEPKTPETLLQDPIENIPLANEANVLIPGTVKAFAVNRYIDPSNGRIMHERHVVYRIEEDPRWRLSANPEKQILVGNTYSSNKTNYNPALMEKELALELQRQRLINACLESQSKTLIDTAINVNEKSDILTKLIKQNQQLPNCANKMRSE